MAVYGNLSCVFVRKMTPEHCFCRDEGQTLPFMDGGRGTWLGRAGHEHDMRCDSLDDKTCGEALQLPVCSVEIGRAIGCRKTLQK